MNFDPSQITFPTLASTVPTPLSCRPICCLVDTVSAVIELTENEDVLCDCDICRNAGESVVLDVRQSRRVSPSLPLPLTTRVETPAGRRSVTGVLGRRDLPSRGLPVTSAPLKRCRVDTPSSRPPADHAHFVIQRDDVTDDEGDWNKENQRPGFSRDGQTVTVERRARRRRCDFDSTASSRCADSCQYSPANHVYHTLEPTIAASADMVASPVYETIDFDDTVDVSTELCGQRLRQSGPKPPSRSHLVSVSQQRQRDSASLKRKKRVTFNVSISHISS